MILDEQALFSDEQAITTTAPSTNTIKTNGDISKGTPVEVLVKVTTAFTGLTSLKVGVETSDAENFGTATTLVETPAILTADLVKGYEFPLKFLPKGIKKYLRLKYTVVGTATAGKITAGIVDGNVEAFA